MVALEEKVEFVEFVDSRAPLFPHPLHFRAIGTFNLKRIDRKSLD